MSAPAAVAAPPALALDDLEVAYRVRGIERQVLRGVTFAIARGRGLRARRRVRLRQVDGGARDRPLPAAQRPRHRRVDRGRGRDLLALSDDELRATARGRRVSMVYQNPGARAEPVDPRRRPGGGGLRDRRRRPARGARARAATMLAQGADRGPGARHAPLPAPALRRHAAARRDRHGARQGPDAADPRRADHRPRRHRRGGGARPRRRAARGVRHERPLHQPQPRRHRADVRPRRRALRRAGWSRRARPETVFATRATPTPSACCAACRAPACARTRAARHDPRLPAAARRRPARLRLRRPLRARAGDLPPRGAAALSTSARPHEPLPLPRAGARVPRADAAPRACQRRRRGAPSRSIRTEGIAQDLPQDGPRVRALDDVSLDAAPRRDARPRRRVRQRQDHARAPPARPRRADDGLGVELDGADARAALDKRDARRRCARCRSSSRTPTRRSTGAPPCAASSAAR